MDVWLALHNLIKMISTATTNCHVDLIWNSTKGHLGIMIQDEDSTDKVISENLVQLRAKYFVNPSRAVSTIFQESQVNNMAADGLVFNYLCQRSVEKWLTMNEKMFPQINSLCEDETRVSLNRSWLAI